MSLIDQSLYSTHFITRGYLQAFYSDVEHSPHFFFRAKSFQDFFFNSLGPKDDFSRHDVIFT